MPCGQGARKRRTVPTSTFKAPGRLRQMAVFFLRDVVSKLANRQYVLINLLQAPLLALVMAFFLRYAGTGADGHAAYVYRHNDNIPQYLFIAVIVALFLGLTVAAEEIIRDRKILQREKFLSLSRTGYLLSKIAVLFIISAVQSLLFTWVGDRVLGFSGLFLEHWAVLFSVSCFANVLGLNVSASFNSAKVIYIMIPVLIIPQLLFSGIIVRFDKLHPWFASEKRVPWIGNIMASRWAYEGLAVTQFKDNAYETSVLRLRQRMKTANWKKDLWARELKERAAQRQGGLGRQETAPRHPGAGPGIDPTGNRVRDAGIERIHFPAPGPVDARTGGPAGAHRAGRRIGTVVAALPQHVQGSGARKGGPDRTDDRYASRSRGLFRTVGPLSQ
jgi:hypothetical protein